MTKTLKLATVLFASLLIFGTSCNKYEDGPKLSLRTKKARMVNTWEVTEAKDGDSDITEFSEGATITLDKEGNYKTGGETKLGPVQETEGTWEFSSDKTRLILTEKGATLPEKWTITRLKNDELWLKKDQSNGTQASTKYKGLD